SFSFVPLTDRYCVDGPINTDDDEVSWSCEDCVPRIPQHVTAIRKSERIGTILDREEQRRKARRNRRNHSSGLKVVEKSNSKVVGDASNLDEKKNGIIKRKQGKLKENGIISDNEGNHSNGLKVDKSNRKVVGDASNLDEKEDGIIKRNQGKLKENVIVCGLKVEKSNSKVVGDVSNLDEKNNGIIKRKQGKLEEDGIVSDNEGNHLIVSKVEKTNCVGKSTNQEVDDASNLDAKKNGIVKRKQGKLKENNIPVKKGGSPPSPQTRQKKMVLNSKDGENKKSSEPTLLTGQKTEDLSNFYINGEDLQKNLELDLDAQLSNKPEHCLESTYKADETSDGKQGIGSSEATKQPDGAEGKFSDNIEATNADSASHQMNEDQCGFGVYELQIPRKKRRLVIAMEFSDSDEDPSYFRHELTQLLPDAGKGPCDSSSSEPLAKQGENGLEQSIAKSDDHFPTRPSPICSDNHMHTQTSFIDSKNCSIPQLLPEIYIPAQPIINAVWRGQCSISNDVHHMSFRLEAHLSNKAHAKVHGAASALPNLLDFEIMQKCYAWPKSFEESPPTGDAIGLYFFPVEESDEKWYSCLLDDMIECDLALKSHINNLELLVFCSQELPVEERRFQSKYYMWGVFKRKQQTSSTSQPSDVQTSNTKYDRSDLVVPGTDRSSVSPSSADDYSVIDSSNSHLHHKAGNRVEFTPSIILKHPKHPKHPKLAYNGQGYNSQAVSNDIESLGRRIDHQNSRNLFKPQEHANSIRDAKSPCHERESKLYKRNHEIRQGKSMQSSHSHSLCRSAMC
ncbi:5'-methylthioadenosine/S-adenosylhomocysteine nucleosidase, partial [Bienertia sinuspersici]